MTQFLGKGLPASGAEIQRCRDGFHTLNYYGEQEREAGVVAPPVVKPPIVEPEIPLSPARGNIAVLIALAIIALSLGKGD